MAHTYHQCLLGDLRKFLERLNYLWAVNREMRLMAAVGSIDKAIASNISDFKKFSWAIAHP